MVLVEMIVTEITFRNFRALNRFYPTRKDRVRENGQGVVRWALSRGEKTIKHLRGGEVSLSSLFPGVNILLKVTIPEFS
jgi:hypothetical protein